MAGQAFDEISHCVGRFRVIFPITHYGEVSFIFFGCIWDRPEDQLLFSNVFVEPFKPTIYSERDLRQDGVEKFRGNNLSLEARILKATRPKRNDISRLLFFNKRLRQAKI